MKRELLIVLAIGLWLTVARSGWAVELKAKAVAEIEKLGGRVTVDEKKPDKPVRAIEGARPVTAIKPLRHKGVRRCTEVPHRAYPVRGIGPRSYGGHR
jgi:hypothetical protein